MIKAVLLDLFETLVTERHLAPVRASSLGERLGLESTAFRARWRSQRPRVLRGQLSFADALPLMMTEKDAVKLQVYAELLGEVRVLRQDVRWERGLDELRGLLRGVLAPSR